MSETKTPYETTVTALPFAPEEVDPEPQAPGYEPRLVLLHVPTWPVGGRSLKLLLVVVREDVPQRDGVVVDAVPVYQDGLYDNYAQLRQALQVPALHDRLLGHADQGERGDD